MKFIEIGIGNRWFIRTETEFNNGTEYEEKGIVKPIRFHSAYFRIWLRKTVWIIDLKEGFKKGRKNRKAFKVLFGIASY